MSLMGMKFQLLHTEKIRFKKFKLSLLHCKLCVWDLWQSMYSQILDAFPHPAERDSLEKPTVLSPLCPGTCQPEEEMQGVHILYKLETAMDAQRKTNQNNDPSIRQIQNFLEPHMEVNMENYLLPPKTLLRYALLLDIVRPTCRRSVCFTKRWVQ